MNAPTLLAVGAAFVSTACGSPDTPRRPSIVVVLVDDMRWDEMRVAGHPFIDTPHRDRVAREGVRPGRDPRRGDDGDS